VSDSAWERAVSVSDWASVSDYKTILDERRSREARNYVGFGVGSGGCGVGSGVDGGGLRDT
jgi:hypothetical protein